MKKVLGALLLVIAVAFTSTVSASTNDNIPIGVEYVVTVPLDGDVAILNAYLDIFHPSLVFDGEKVINKESASVEGLVESVPIVNVALINGIVNRNLVASVEGLIKVFSLSRGNSTNGTEFVKIFLPVEVGLSNSNILNT